MPEIERTGESNRDTPGLRSEACGSVTERPRADLFSDLHQNTWFQTALATIGDAIVATDTLERVTFLNLSAERMTGWTQADAAGKQLRDVFQIVNAQTRFGARVPAGRCRLAVRGLAASKW